jgi:hypothetical protein
MKESEKGGQILRGKIAVIETRQILARAQCALKEIGHGRFC